MLVFLLCVTVKLGNLITFKQTGLQKSLDLAENMPLPCLSWTQKTSVHKAGNDEKFCQRYDKPWRKGLYETNFLDWVLHRLRKVFVFGHKFDSLKKILRLTSLEGDEKEAWETLEGVIIHRFLGNKRDYNYTQLVTVLLEKYCQLWCNTSLKMHFFSPT